jgi:ABC-type glycerol-3-phosphate transport system permease component
VKGAKLLMGRAGKDLSWAGTLSDRMGMRLQRRIERILTHLVLAVVGAMFLLPFYWMITASIKTSAELNRMPPTWLPHSFTLEHYPQALTLEFGRYFLNSFIYATATTIIVAVSSTLLGFVLAKFPSRLGEIFFVAILASMAVPFNIYVLPLFMLLFRIQKATAVPMLNTYWGMVFPWLVYPFGTFLMRQAMLSVPNELLDAARIDGSSTLRTFWQIVLPLVRPNVAALCIFVFIWRYDEILWPLVVATESKMYPISVGLAEFIGEYFVEYGQFTAASVVAITPILVMYILLQRNIIRGIALTGMKG